MGELGKKWGVTTRYLAIFRGKVGEKLRLKRRLRVGEDDLREWLEKRKIGK